MYFDRDKAIFSPGTSTDSRQAAWLELMLIQFAFFLGIGVSASIRPATRPEIWPRSQVRITATPALVAPIYLVPVHTYITTQDDFFEVHVSGYNKKKELIDAGDYKKGKHQHPELRQKQDPALRKKQDPALRKKQDPALRKKYKKQDPALRKKQGPALRKKQDPALRKAYIPA
jgi:hypothetical protein